MTINNKITNHSVWWVEFLILNSNTIKFSYQLSDNTFFFHITTRTYPFFIYFLKFLPQSNLFQVLDLTNISLTQKNELCSIYQSVFNNLKLCIIFPIINQIFSSTNIFKSNTWLERELKEFSVINIQNLIDTRKLLLNYNYNNTLKFNQYSSIISDINI